MCIHTFDILLLIFNQNSRSNKILMKYVPTFIRMNLRSLVLLVITFPILNGILYDDKLPKNDEILSYFIEKYFQNQKIIKIFAEVCVESDWSSDTIVKELYRRKSVVLYDFKHIDEEKFIFFPNFGYFTKTSSITRNFLEQISKIRSNGKWLVVVDENTDTKMLRTAWDDYQMLHLVTLSIDLRVSFYNPFINNNNSRGVIYNQRRIIDPNSVDAIITEIVSRARNLHGHELHAYMDTPAKTYTNPVFDHKGNVVRYTGIDGEILEAIRHSMNFKVKFIPLLSKKYLLEIRAKNITQMIEKHEIDLIPDGHLVNRTSVKGIYPLTILGGTEIMCALRANHKSDVINILFGFLDIYGTMLFYLTTGIFTICLYLSVKIRENFFKYMIDILGLEFNISISLHKYHTLASRLVLTSIFILNLTIVATFQATVTSKLNVASKAKQINTLDDLITHNITILTVPSIYRMLKTNYDNTSNSIHDRLFKQFLYNDALVNVDVFKKISTDENFRYTGSLIRKYQALFLEAQYIDKNTGLSNLHVVRERIAVVPMTFHLPKWSPFISVMNEMMIRVLEMGFIQKGFDDANHIIWLERMRAYRNVDPNIEKVSPITVDDLSLTFGLYLSTIFVALVVFLFEIMFHKK